MPTDVTKAEQCRRSSIPPTKAFGRVDILVNNAGTNIKDRTIRELTPESWEMMVRTNLDGAFYCTKAVLPQMLERKDGVIVNVVSVAGKRANPLGGAAYVAAKFGMGALGWCWRRRRRTAASASATSTPARSTRRSWRPARSRSPRSNGR